MAGPKQSSLRRWTANDLSNMEIATAVALLTTVHWRGIYSILG